jgi:hypothetical protein
MKCYGENPHSHLRTRYGRRVHGPIPTPDCALCERFVADLPVRYIPEWLRATTGSQRLLRTPPTEVPA